HLLGTVYWEDKRFAEAERELTAAKDIREALRKDAPGDSAYAVYLGGTYCNLGLLASSQRQDSAVTWFDKAVATLTADRPASDEDLVGRQFLLNAYRGRANFYAKVGKFAESARDWRFVIVTDRPESKPVYQARLAYILSRTPDHREARSAAARRRGWRRNCQRR